jgi:hypothetical protein
MSRKPVWCSTRTFALIAAILVVVGCRSVKPLDPEPATLDVRSIPPASVGHALVYHHGLRAVLLVNAGLGGETSPPSNSKTILRRWTGEQWVLQDSVGPPIRNLGGVAYDISRNVLVLHGGSYSLDLVYGETWEWSVASGWSNKGVGGPGARDHVDMAFDAASNRVILHGGQVSLDSFPSDTWAWDGNVWERVSTSGPGRRIHHAMAFSPELGRVVLFGGFRPPNSSLGDTWSWTGAAWQPAATNIIARSHARLGYTSAGLILYGGFRSPGAPTILRLQNRAWTNHTPATNPGERYLTAMAYDPLRGVTVLFGGGDPTSHTIYGDTWEYHASTGWRQIPLE